MDFFEVISSPRELTLFELIMRIVCATLLGGILGIERGLKHRPAGLRTYMLVCISACIVMITNQFICQVYGTGDPGRMGAQVISGIGFLGAGTIMITPHSQIKGLTTAAGLWASACIGLAIGIGFWEVAVIGTVTIFLVLKGLNFLDHFIHERAKEIEVFVDLDCNTSISDFIQYAKKNDINVYKFQEDRKNSTELEGVSFVAVLSAQKRTNRKTVLEVMQSMDGVVQIISL